MNHRTPRGVFVLILPAVLVLWNPLYTASASAVELSEVSVGIPLDDTHALTPEQRFRLARLVANPQIGQVTVWQVNPADLLGELEVVFDLTPLPHIALERHIEGLLRPGDRQWVFRDDSQRRFAHLIVRNLRMVGFVKLADRHTLVYPLADELVAVVTLTEPLRQILAPAECDFAGITPPTDELVLCTPDPSSSCCEFTVLAAYTPYAAQLAGSPTLLENKIEGFVADTNQSYAESNVLTRMRVSSVYKVDYDNYYYEVFEREYTYIFAEEDTDLSVGCFNLFKEDLSKVQQTDDGVMDEVHQLRDLYAADVVTYMPGYTLCGSGLACDVLAQAHTAFALLSFIPGAPPSKYTFAHEVGHLQGAGHEPGLGQLSYSPFDYGHGYVVPGASSTGTIMTVGTDTRLGVWSNPNLTEPGGSATGTEDHNNSRVLNETACRVARFRVPGTIEVDPPALLLPTEYQTPVTVTVKTNDGPMPGVLVVAESDDPAVANLVGTASEQVTDAAGTAQVVIMGQSYGNTKIRIRSLGAEATIPVRVWLDSMYPW